MHSSIQLVTLSLLPLAINALPQPQDTWSSGSDASGSWSAGSDTSGGWSAGGSASGGWSAGGAAAGGDTWAAASSPAAWEATTPAAVSPAAQASVYDPNAWATQVTWPAGCETWANPCPSGAVVAGGGYAATSPAAVESGAASSQAYTNPYTSYLTQTNSDGIITGMPSKATSMPDVATVPAGVSSGYVVPGESSTLVAVPSGVAVPTGGFGSNGTSSASPSMTGFAQTTGNGAGAVRGSALLCAIGSLIALLL